LAPRFSVAPTRIEGADQLTVALRLASLRKRIEIALLSDDVVLQLDGLAEANATAADAGAGAAGALRVLGTCTHTIAIAT
jgi:predicted ATP-dependent serine protease